MTLNEVLQRLDKVRKSGRGYMACCPGHDDRNPSLAIDSGDDGRILLKCFSGCDIHQIATGLGVSLSDLMGDKKGERLSPLHGLGKRHQRLPTQSQIVSLKAGAMNREVAMEIIDLARAWRESGRKLSLKDQHDELKAFNYLRGVA